MDSWLSATGQRDRNELNTAGIAADRRLDLLSLVETRDAGLIEQGAVDRHFLGEAGEAQRALTALQIKPAHDTAQRCILCRPHLENRRFGCWSNLGPAHQLRHDLGGRLRLAAARYVRRRWDGGDLPSPA